jgi:sigma-B regulation protein RsbU (phosphoserine phosphatase)
MHNESPSEIMERVNKEIVNFFHEKRHITAFLGIYDSTTKQLSFTKGGHPSPILLHAREKRLEYLMNGGLPLGMFSDIHYDVSNAGLTGGDCLVLYTDGLTECCNAHDALFGKKRLEDVLLALPEESSTNDILGALIRAQLSFSGTAQRSDDITIVIVKIP